MTATVRAGAGAAPRLVLLTLASAQFLMTLDSSVMNVSIATVAADLNTTVTGIQTAITRYTLVMASLMITGAKAGEILGRRRAFAAGCVVYALGSFTTAIAPNLPVLLLGWSFLEGIGAALIMPAIVALVASNFDRSQRPRAYGLVAAAGAIAVAAGPLIGGLLTTYASWRWVFAGEVVIVLAILLLARRLTDAWPERAGHLDLVGIGLSTLGLALVVLGILRAGDWGFVNPKPGPGRHRRHQRPAKRQVRSLLTNIDHANLRKLVPKLADNRCRFTPTSRSADALVALPARREDRDKQARGRDHSGPMASRAANG